MDDRNGNAYSGGAAMQPAPTPEIPIPVQQEAPAPREPQLVEDPYAGILLPPTPVGEEMMRNRYGQYVWFYELNLLKNPTVFLLVWKIFFFIILGIFAFTALMDLFEGRFGVILGTLPILGYFLIGMTVLVGISYLIYAAVMRGKYVVKFEMDEKGINHKQVPAQAAKAEKIGMITTAVGAMTGNFTTMGVGMNAQRSEMYTAFARVRKVKLYPRRGLIKLNGILQHNQVYVTKGDYEFVRDYILTRCVNVRKKKK